MPSKAAAAMEAHISGGGLIDSRRQGTAPFKTEYSDVKDNGVDDSVTNLDRFIQSVTPSIPPRFSKSEKEGVAKRWRKKEVNSQPFFYLEDLWDSFHEWSAYGVGVPLLLNDDDDQVLEQYYVPSLSGMQLYMTSRGDAGNSKGVRRAISDLGLNTQNKSLGRPASYGDDIANSPSFQFLEYDKPYHRRPLTDQMAFLASQYPQLNKCRSCDLLPTSWICVAWYPIYKVPSGSTLKDLDAAFLVLHSLSTQAKNDAYNREAKISLPVIGITSYKLRGSAIGPRNDREYNQEESLFQAADEWLQKLKVKSPDHQFFDSWRKPFRS